MYVDQIRFGEGDCVIVHFESQLGSAYARWIGSTPERGIEYDVELEVPGTLRWGREIRGKSETTVAEERIFEQGGTVHLVGRLESIDEQGTGTIRFGGDIVLIEIVDVPRTIPGWVHICVPQLQLFDISL